MSSPQAQGLLVSSTAPRSLTPIPPLPPCTPSSLGASLPPPCPVWSGLLCLLVLGSWPWPTHLSSPSRPDCVWSGLVSLVRLLPLLMLLTSPLSLVSSRRTSLSHLTLPAFSNPPPTAYPQPLRFVLATRVQPDSFTYSLSSISFSS